MEKLDTKSSIPLYKQVANIMIKELNKVKSEDTSEIIGSDDKLLAERNLSERFNVSRITIRQAMGVLEEENYVNRIQGKGTFVNREKIVRPLQESKSFTSLILDSGHTPGAKLKSAGIQLASLLDQQVFDLTADDYVFVMKRLRFVDDIACAYEVTHYKKTFSNLGDLDFDNKSLYDFLQKEMGYDFHTVEKTIEIVYADEEISKIFNIELNTPVVLLKGIVANQDGEIIINVFEYLLSDKFIFKV